MAIKLIIKDFEIIEEAKLSVAGLVALVGESNNGKTAIYNAVKVLTYNIQGQNYIRKMKGVQVESGCNVGMLLEEENTKIFFNKAGSPVYQIIVGDRTSVFDKAGRGPTPTGIAEVLNMQSIDLDGLSVNLNFVDQMSEPLLNRLSDYQMYKIAVKSFDGEKLQEAIVLCKKDGEKKADELKEKEKEINVQKKNSLYITDQIERFEELANIEKEFDLYSKQCLAYPVVQEVYNTRQSVLRNMQIKSREVYKFEGLDKISAEVDVYIYTQEELQYCFGVHNRREGILALLS